MADNLMRVTFRTDFTNLNIMDASIKEATSEGIQDLMEYIVETYIPSRWSETSPSAAGQPPAIVTGTLGGSIHYLRRDSAGHFAILRNAVSWVLEVDAEYAAALEFGVPERGLAPRPFIRPAIKEAETLIGKYITTRVSFMPQKYGMVRSPFKAQRAYEDNDIEAMG